MNPTPTQIANKIELYSGIKIFKKTRRRPIIELRSLLVFLLREKLGMRWLNIALFFKSRGLPIHHATLIWSNKRYKMYKKTNSHLQEIEKLFSFKFNLTYDEIDKVYHLENKCKLLESKYKSPLFNLIKDIPENRETEAVKRIGIMIQNWS
tara:strand:- start:690 stop:1142 length:453 start_codon:yes stop_codon:yes gene_type:complete